MAEEFDLEVVTVDSEREAHRGADIVCGCTDTQRPVIMGEWLEPGCHVTDIGGGLDRSVFDRVDVALRLGTTPAPVGLPELKTDRSFVLYRAGGEPQRPRAGVAEGGGGDERARLGGKLVMLEDLLAGRAVGRTSPEQVTFSTRGNIQGAQFFAVAGAVFQAARAANLGQQIPTEWFLQDIRD
jgi:ornithine cyclodeaminase/alanine dehydrogenase-like protein (mu-crystallin family)